MKVYLNKRNDNIGLGITFDTFSLANILRWFYIEITFLKYRLSLII